MSSPASSRRKRDGRSSVSSPPTAVTTSGAPRPRHGDVEQPALLGEQLVGGRPPRGGRAPAASAEPGAASASSSTPSSEPRSRRSGQVLLLHAGHDDDIPLQALGPVRGQDADRLARGGPLGQRVAGDLLAGQAVEEQARRARRQPFGIPGGRIEQREHRVEIPVGGRAASRRPRRRRPARRAASPDASQTAQRTSPPRCSPAAMACRAAASSRRQPLPRAPRPAAAP